MATKTDHPSSLLQALLGSIGAMPVLLASFLGLTYWGGWTMGACVLPLVIVHGAVRRGATGWEACAVGAVALMFVVALLRLV